MRQQKAVALQSWDKSIGYFHLVLNVTVDSTFSKTDIVNGFTEYIYNKIPV